MPGAVLAQEAPRFMQRLAYTFTADLFARHSEANSYSNALDWIGRPGDLADDAADADAADAAGARLDLQR